MSKRRNIIDDQTLTMGDMLPSTLLVPAGQNLTLIPRDQMAREFRRQKAEERKFWKGRSVLIELVVELPFWLLIPDGQVTITHGKTSLVLTINSQFAEISDGPDFLDSRSNVICIDRSDAIPVPADLYKLASKQAPIYRPMRTVVSINANGIEEVFTALSVQNVADNDHSAIRGINRGNQYLQVLAFAHIPFLNALITSYRSVSHDPYAFEVSEWDVPFWFAKHKGTLNRICLMPYSNNFIRPLVRRKGETTPLYSTTLESVQRQAVEQIIPGKLELLDAFGLMFRGRFGDCVRSVVTAIEVALDEQLIKLLRSKGLQDAQINERLNQTRNNFFERLADYEQLSQRRVPGPLINPLPHINGLRLREELEWVRTLRHKIVHEGIRVDIEQRGTTQRAFETMAWLFEWLCPDDKFGPDDYRSYTYFN
jgi:hypothetical protein